MTSWQRWNAVAIESASSMIGFWLFGSCCPPAESLRALIAGPWSTLHEWLRTLRIKFSALLAVAAILTAIGNLGCSLRKVAINKIGDSLASSGDTFASDDDPELIGSAVPFSLKLMESVLAESPRHRSLLVAAASGFTQYAFVYVQLPADEMESHDLNAAQAMRGRARRLYLRARDYGLRGLEINTPGFSSALRRDRRSATAGVRSRTDVPLLYWTAAAWGLAISVSKDNPALIADQPLVEALIDRALALDPDFLEGAIHGFLIAYEPARQGVAGDFAERCRTHFDRQVALTGGELAAPYVSLAEAVSIQKQNRQEFESLLGTALAIDPDNKPQWRLNNIVMQRRARWLLGREEELFVPSAVAAMPNSAYAIALTRP
ncbi:MAG: TRAP transporter TatT component family protein [Acidobacteria bacterium]|nr:TRAP transporter TatT component family protein [Acidobacteriota bacterium]